MKRNAAPVTTDIQTSHDFIEYFEDYDGSCFGSLFIEGGCRRWKDFNNQEHARLDALEPDGDVQVEQHLLTVEANRNENALNVTLSILDYEEKSTTRGAGRPAWLRLATINIALLIVLALILLGVLIYGCVRASSLNAAFILYQGPCSTSQKINISVHLLLNVFSTLILASSNFFMQIINAPSRDDLDRAHARSGWVNIGVPSMRNFLYLGPAKFACWFVLACSSIPIHLFFNSLVFQVAEVRSGFGMTMAAEDFLDGAKYYGPGASLWNTAVPTNCSDYPGLKNEDCWRKGPGDYAGIGSTSSFTVRPEMWMDRTSKESMNISTAAIDAQKSWQRLEPADCRSKFLFCDGGIGIQGYKSVVLVVNATEPRISGWKRDEVFPNMTSSDNKFWNTLIPAKEKNALWYYEHCQIGASFDSRKGCSNTCKVRLGYDLMATESPLVVDPRDDTKSSTWTFRFYGSESLEMHLLDAQTRSGFDTYYDNLDISYCLAEREDQHCKIGVSNLILLATTICVLVKISQCAFFLFRYVLKSREDPLVTPGDAVKSLISRPDQTTVRMCTLEMRDIQLTWERILGANPKQKDYHQTDGIELLHGNLEHSFLAPQARQWRSRRIPTFYALPVSTWARTYVLFLVVLIVSTYYLVKAAGSRSVISGAFGNSGLNNFVTMDKNYGAADKYTDFYGSSTANSASSAGSLDLSHIGFVAVGYSTVAGLIAIVVFIVILCIPLVLSLRELPGDMVVVGSNSLALAAACHVPATGSSVSGLGRRNSGTACDTEMMTFARDARKPECSSRVLLDDMEVTQRRIKWGVLKMEDSFYRELEGDVGIDGIKHLSFGMEEEDRVEPPRLSECVDTDTLLGLLEETVRFRSTFRLVIMSATFHADNFISHFRQYEPAMIQVSGKTYPVEIQYLSETTPEYTILALCLTKYIHEKKSPGNILVFLAARHQIDSAVTKLRIDVPRLEAFSLYAGLSKEKQTKAL
ncbi:hypothetical protein FHETE_7966 [Fusarium heterosporum]|uniref:DUF6536 domain-containing protein n=1 Tax=Fusarium heterosporum TaxID=42747 RepID=A0A8H5WKX8_FUSHE|nr:hypothetical protein FHETE_7966 [Fusarium heterosporum]